MIYHMDIKEAETRISFKATEKVSLSEARKLYDNWEQLKIEAGERDKLKAFVMI